MTVNDWDPLNYTETQLEHAPRVADVLVGKTMPGGGWTMDTLASYIWDHWMGEPADPEEDLVYLCVCQAVLDKLLIAQIQQVYGKLLDFETRFTEVSK
jgi:hypothetical protein